MIFQPVLIGLSVATVLCNVIFLALFRPPTRIFSRAEARRFGRWWVATALRFQAIAIALGAARVGYLNWITLGRPYGLSGDDAVIGLVLMSLVTLASVIYLVSFLRVRALEQ